MGRKRTPREEQIIKAFAVGASVETISEQVGVPEVSLRRRMTDEAFMKRVREERDRISLEVGVRLMAWAKVAGQYLAVVVQDPNAPTHARVRAAGIMLTEARAWMDADLHERLTELENTLLAHGINE